MSQDTADFSPSRKKEFLGCFEREIPCVFVPQPVLRDEMTKDVKFAIRTGYFTAFSNIILVSAGGPRWYSEQ